jgi:hypothetical protein
LDRSAVCQVGERKRKSNRREKRITTFSADVGEKEREDVHTDIDKHTEKNNHTYLKHLTDIWSE